MNLKTKMILVVAAAVSATVLVATWKFSKIFQEQTIAQTQNSVSRQANLARQSLEIFSESVATQLQTYISREAGARHSQQNFSKSTPLAPEVTKSDFLLLSVLKVESGRWVTKWTSFSQDLLNKLPPLFLESKLTDLPLARAGAGKTIWSVVMLPNRTQLLCVFMAMQQVGSAQTDTVIGLGFLPINYFTMANVSLGEGAEFFVVDEKMQALTHDKPEYLGTSLQRNPLVETLLAPANKVQVASYQAEGGAAVGAIEKLSNSNLYVLVGELLPTGGQLFGRFLAGISIELLALLVVLGGLTYLLSSSAASGLSYLREYITKLSQGTPVALPQDQTEELAELAPALARLQETLSGNSVAEQEKVRTLMAEKERLQDFKDVGRSLSQSMKTPLAAILGHVQVVKGQTKNDRLQGHLKLIEKEARQIRETIDTFLRSVGGETTDEKRIDLQQVVTQALENVQGQIAKKSIKVNKNLEEGTFVIGNRDQIRVAIEQVIKNAIEAMGEMARRELTVNLEENAGVIHIVVKDTGVGIKSTDLEKIFDPMFSTKKEQTMGLGLTMARGIVKGYNGNIKVESRLGEGSQVTIEFPAPNNPVSLSAPESVPEVKVTKAVEPVVVKADEAKELPLDVPRSEASVITAQAETQSENEPKTTEMPRSMPWQEPEGATEITNFDIDLEEEAYRSESVFQLGGRSPLSDQGDLRPAAADLAQDVPREKVFPDPKPTEAVTPLDIEAYATPALKLDFPLHGAPQTDGSFAIRKPKLKGDA